MAVLRKFPIARTLVRVPGVNFPGGGKPVIQSRVKPNIVQNPSWQRDNMQFPGQGNLFPSGTPEDVIRTFIKNQKRVKGFVFDVPAGGSNFPIQISGEAKMLLGLSLISLDNLGAPDLQPTQFFLTINNEIVINELHPVFLSPDFMDEEYYVFIRPLSGQDDIAISFVNPFDAQKIALALYYL